MRWQREGFGWWTNLGIGLVGALVGGLLFRLFNILPGLDAISISLRDVVVGGDWLVSVPVAPVGLAQVQAAARCEWRGWST